MPPLHTASIVLAACIAALPGVAAAAPTAPPVLTTARAMPRAQTIDLSRTVMSTPRPDESGIDRKFHPDYSKALTPAQMTAAWNAEIDRVFETPVTGGG
jgi:hypothetical protein